MVKIKHIIIKSANKFLKFFRLQLQNITPIPIPLTSDTPRTLQIGTYNLEVSSAELIKAYHDYPESNTVIARLVGFLAQQGPISSIDIGANCGDTLAIAKTASSISEVLCVEGDESLLLYLKKNSEQFNGVTIQSTYLGEVSGQMHVSIEKRGFNNTLVGTAVGEIISILTLDELVGSWSALAHLKFIKCDTEGYDVRILFGARETLRTYRPVVLFEYNQVAMSLTGEDGFRVFSYLQELQYDMIFVYDNFGRFILATDIQHQDRLRDLLDYADARAGRIYYYDVIVFHQSDVEIGNSFLHLERLHRSRMEAL